MIGDGPTGFEFVHIFSALSIDVTWLVLSGGLSCAIAPDADTFLVDMLLRRGVQIRPGEPVAALRRYEDHVTAVKPDGSRFEAEIAFVTIGNRPNVAPLNLEAIGVQADALGSVLSDGYGLTNIEGICVVGDAGGSEREVFQWPKPTLQHFMRLGRKPDPLMRLVWSFLSNSQVAQVGV